MTIKSFISYYLTYQSFAIINIINYSNYFDWNSNFNLFDFNSTMILNFKIIDYCYYYDNYYCLIDFINLKTCYITSYAVDIINPNYSFYYCCLWHSTINFAYELSYLKIIHFNSKNPNSFWLINIWIKYIILK